MIQKRYKQTEQLAQAQGLKAMIEAMPVLLAQVPLPEITDMPNHNQVLRVEDVNVVTSVDFIKITPKRILIHKITNEELDLKLPVPEWVINKDNMTSMVDANGERLLFEMEWYDDENDEVVTVDEFDVALPEIQDEAFTIPSIPYLMFFTKQVVLPDLIQMFSAQFVNDNIDVWAKLN